MYYLFTINLVSCSSNCFFLVTDIGWVCWTKSVICVCPRLRLDGCWKWWDTVGVEMIGVITEVDSDTFSELTDEVEDHRIHFVIDLKQYQIDDK